MELLNAWQQIGQFCKDFVTPLSSSIVGVITAGFIVWKKWGRNWYKHYKSGRTARFDLIQLKMDKIIHQLYPNGGSSLNDMVQKIWIHQQEQDVVLAELKAGQLETREVMGMIYWESDASGRVTTVSSNLCDMLNCSPANILGNSWVGLVEPNDRRRIIDAWKLSTDNASQFNEEFTFLTCDRKEKIKVKVTARHTKDKEQKLLKSLVRFVPINE